MTPSAFAAPRRRNGTRGIALVSVLLCTALLIALVTALVDLGTLSLQRATAQLRGVQALGGADAGVAWARALLAQQHGDVIATLGKLALVQGRRRFPIDDRTYVVDSVTLTLDQGGSNGDHVDDNVQQTGDEEHIVQVQSSAALYVDGSIVTHRVTTTLLRVFGATPYSEIAGTIDGAGPVGIESPGDAAGQAAAPATTELLVHVYTFNSGQTTPKSEDVYQNSTWSDGNASGPGALP